MKLRFKPYELHLKHRFSVSGCSRTFTPAVLTEIEHDGVVGYGEASMPPYLGETAGSVTDFLSKIDAGQFRDPFLVEDILGYVEGIAPGNKAAKASFDIALHDLTGKLAGMPCHRMLGLGKDKTPYTTYTIGMDSDEMLGLKVKEAGDRFSILKVKLGSADDKGIIRAIRKHTGLPLAVDVNQGWKCREEALDMIFWLKEQGVVSVEQPMPKDCPDDMAWLNERSPLPLYADESVQTAQDIPALRGLFGGVNIKLMKCGGMREALKMIHTARALGMRVMLGCMTETSCAVSAAAQLSPLADIADLDGNLLIAGDPFEGVKISGGRLMLNDLPGIGVVKHIGTI